MQGFVAPVVTVASVDLLSLPPSMCLREVGRLFPVPCQYAHYALHFSKHGFGALVLVMSALAYLSGHGTNNSYFRRCLIASRVRV